LLRLLAAATQPKAAVSKSTSLIMNGWPLLPLQHSKNHTDAATQSLSRTMLEKRGQKGKFFRHQKFALLLKEAFQKSMLLDADFDWKISLIMV
jgi:hypothetical protein